MRIDDYEDFTMTERFYTFEDGTVIIEAAEKGNKLGPAKPFNSYNGSPLIDADFHSSFQSFLGGFMAKEDMNPTISVEHDVSSVEKNTKYFGIRVYIFTRNEHGNLYNRETPAHVHVFTINGKKLCKINITGECPRDNKTMLECVFDITNNKSLPDGIPHKLVNWANYVRTTYRGKIKNWDYAKDYWKNNIERINTNSNNKDNIITII